MSKFSTVVLLLVACTCYTLAQNPRLQRLLIVRSTNSLGNCLNYKWKENADPKKAKLIGNESYKDQTGKTRSTLLYSNPKDNSAPPFFSTNVFNLLTQSGGATKRVLKIDNDGTTVKYTWTQGGVTERISCGFIGIDNASANREPTPKQKQAILRKCPEKGMQDVSQANCANI